MWTAQIMIVSLALIVIYPSEFLSLFQGDAANPNNRVKSAIYYLFLAGVYHEDQEDVGLKKELYFSKINIYLEILAMIMVERICLGW